MTCDGIGMTEGGVTETEGCPIRSGMTEGEVGHDVVGLKVT